MVGCTSEKKEENKSKDQAFTMIDSVTDADEDDLMNGKTDETVKGDVLVEKSVVGSSQSNVKNLTASECAYIEKQLTASINSARSSKVKSNTKLTKSAYVRSKELVKKFSHTRPNKKSWTTTLTAVKVKTSGNTTGENLAKLTMTAKSSYSTSTLKSISKTIHNCLMNSATHKKVIKNKNYKFVGVRVYTKLSGGKVSFYITQHFTKKC